MMKLIIPYARNRIAYTVLRSLAAQASCFPADSTRLAMARWSLRASGGMCYPDPTRHPAKFSAWCHERVQKGHLLFPVFEESWLLRRNGIFRGLLPPYDDIMRANNKWLVSRRAENLGLKVPKGRFFPDAVAKPVIGRGSQGVLYLRDTLVQERIEGDSVGVGMLWHQGRLKAACAWRRVETFPKSGGWSAIGETISAPEEEAAAEKLMASYNWTGPAMVEFKGGHVIEVNPRWWGSLGLSVAAGVDFPLLMLDLMVSGDCDTVLGWRKGVKASYRAACLRARVKPQGSSMDWCKRDPLPFVVQFALAAKNGLLGRGFQLDGG